MITVLICVIALVLDALLGEPRRGHPLVGFGHLATRLEQRLNRVGQGTRLGGVLAVLLLVLPVLVLAIALSRFLPLLAAMAAEVLVLYFAIGLRSLGEHARAVSRPLATGDVEEARHQVAKLVSRDVQALDASGVSAATTESVLENGADAVLASLFWYVVAGLPGVVLHRLVNTLDAMWGYRTDRFRRFGWFAARLDDLLGWVPARLTALAYALAGRTRLALRCWWQQAGQWSSPNAGPVMAAGAGALFLQLGGAAPYHGEWRQRPLLGRGDAPDADSPERALRLLHRALLLWLIVILTGAGLWHYLTAAG